MGTIKVMAHRVAKTISELEKDVMPNEMDIEFAIKLDLEGGSVLPMVAKTTLGGQFNVKFNWKIEKPTEAKVIVSPNQ